jgi:hypothetical protein
MFGAKDNSVAMSVIGLDVRSRFHLRNGGVRSIGSNYQYLCVLGFGVHTGRDRKSPLRQARNTSRLRKRFRTGLPILVNIEL